MTTRSLSEMLLERIVSRMKADGDDYILFYAVERALHHAEARRKHIPASLFYQGYQGLGLGFFSLIVINDDEYY